MIILTIQFKNSNKTYDYLMHNPDNNKLRPNADINFVTGVTKNHTTYNPATVVGFRKVATLPPHVTAYLMISKNNLVSSSPIHHTVQTTPASDSGVVRPAAIIYGQPIASDTVQSQIRKLRFMNIMLEAKIHSHSFGSIQAQLQQELSDNLALINKLEGGH